MIGVLLLAQWLAAAYACPVDAEALAPNGEPAIVVALAVGCHGMPIAAMDPANPALCKAHCSADEQAPAHAAPDDAPAPVLGRFIVAGFGPLALAGPSADAQAVPASAAPPGWPPLYLIHQVFRN